MAGVIASLHPHVHRRFTHLKVASSCSRNATKAAVQAAGHTAAATAKDNRQDWIRSTIHIIDTACAATQNIISPAIHV